VEDQVIQLEPLG